MAVQLSTSATVAWPLLLRRPVLAGPRRSTVARSTTIASWQLSGRRPCTLRSSSEASRAITSNSTISSRITWRSGSNVRPRTSQLLDCLGLRWSNRLDRLGLSRLSWSRLDLGRFFLSSRLFFFNGFCRRLFFCRFSSLLTFLSGSLACSIRLFLKAEVLVSKRALGRLACNVNKATLVRLACIASILRAILGGKSRLAAVRVRSRMTIWSSRSTVASIATRAVGSVPTITAICTTVCTIASGSIRCAITTLNLDGRLGSLVGTINTKLFVATTLVRVHTVAVLKISVVV